jgi:hypothetical protein
VSSDTEYLQFEESLDDDDFGLIICGKTGKLKGLFIPRGHEDKEVPETIAEICVAVFGIDPNDEIEDFEEDLDGVTIH